MLLLKNGNQIVDASVPGLADMAKVSIEECLEALAVLEAPDKWSRTKDHDGRRIKPVDGGWLILNGAKYRDALTVDDIKDRNRIYQARHRAKIGNGRPLRGEPQAMKALQRGDSKRAEELAEPRGPLD